MRLFGPALAALLIVGGGQSGLAQVKAYTVPISDETVVLRAVIGSTPVRLGVQNGALARFEVKNGPSLGLVPVIHNGGIDLRIMQIFVDPTTGNEGLRQLALRRLVVDTIAQITEGPIPVEVELIRINARAVRGGEELSGPCTTCCVDCGDVKSCACWVILDCGSCCCETACTCWDGSEAPLIRRFGTTGCQSAAEALARSPVRH